METELDLNQSAADWQARGVKLVMVQFTDLEGGAKGKLVPIQHWQSLIDQGAGFAGPSIIGTGLPRTGPRSEYYARIDPSTARILPWLPEVVHVIGSGYVDQQVFAGCPRQVLLRAVQALAQRGYRLNVGIEPEFFLFNADQSAWGPNASIDTLVLDPLDRLDKPSYDLHALTASPIKECLFELHQTLEQFGFAILQIDHEDAPAQFEVNYEFDHALAAADQFMRFKIATHAIARQHGLQLSLMPKPFADRPGSGLHFHLSLDSVNQAIDQPQSNSPIPHAIAGLLAHAPSLALIHAPTVNSYKRLVSVGSVSGTTWAPTHICHGSNNRSAILRTLSDRIEWRIPDPTTNVYLALAGVIFAILDGIDQQLLPPESVDDDISELGLEALRARGITALPQSLAEGIEAFAADSVLQDGLGSDLCEQWLELKQQEWSEFSQSADGWELERYGRRV